MASIFWTIGSLYGASAVAAGAFGAHSLKSRVADPSKLASFSTAAQYQVLPPHTPLSHHPPYRTTNRTLLQLIHSGVLLLTTVAAPQNTLAMGLFTAGMTMFSGSIYLLVLDPQRFRALGPVTPLGGLCLIAGWGALAWKGRIPRVRV